MRLIILQYVVCLTVLYFYILSHKRKYFRRKNGFEHRKCVLIFFYKVFLKSASFSEEFSEILSYVYIHLYVKYPLFMSDFNKIEFSGQILQKYLR